MLFNNMVWHVILQKGQSRNLNEGLADIVSVCTLRLDLIQHEKDVYAKLILTMTRR